MDALAPGDGAVVVGGGVAGWRLCEGLRRYGFTGPITLVGDDPHAPYDRPPLSKQVLAGTWDPERATLARPERLAELGIDARLGRRAVALDVEAGAVTLDDGSRLGGARVALALGVRARAMHVPTAGALATVRSLDDALALRGRAERLEPGARVAVIGGGFLGAEIATSLKARGLEPVVLEAAVRPLVGPLGEAVSTWLAPIAAGYGVQVRTGVRLNDVIEYVSGVRVELEDGVLEAALCVAAVGSALDLAWLDDSGLNLDDGIVVESDLAAAPRVAAIGDAARVIEVQGERGARREHWQVAIDHAEELARAWAGAPPSPVIPTPYFWSDQYGQKIQLLGRPRPDDEAVLVAGAPGEARWLALYVRDGAVTGAVSLSHPRALMRVKPLIDRTAHLGEALAAAPWA